MPDLLCVYCKALKPGRWLDLTTGWSQHPGRRLWTCYDCVAESDPMPKAKTTAPPTTDLLKLKREALPMLAGLRDPVRGLMTLKTADDYAQADEMLGRVTQAIRKWEGMVEPVLGPLRRAEKELKSAMVGAKTLNKEVLDPLEDMALTLRTAMKTFKTAELRLISQQAEDRNRLQRELDRQESLAVTAARAPQRDAAMAKMQVIEEQLADVETTETTTGLHSTVRTRRMWRIADHKAFYQGVADGDIPAQAALPNQVYLNAALKLHGEALVAWPGVELFDDPIIATRG